jgi:hypothetical protein
MASAAGGHAECRFGHNRPAIEAVQRHITAGGTVVGCTEQTMSVTTPSGRQRQMKAWTFRERK